MRTVSVGMLIIALLGTFYVLSFNEARSAQDDTLGQVNELSQKVRGLESQIARMESQIDRMEPEVDEAAPVGLVMYLFGMFCALWAQNTGRNAWLWFFLGILGSVITVMFLLTKNARDRQTADEPMREWRANNDIPE